MICDQESKTHDGLRKKRTAIHKNTICTQSDVSQTIADVIEDGHSERQVVVIANKYLLEIGQYFISQNQLRSVLARIKTVVSEVEKAK